MSTAQHDAAGDHGHEHADGAIHAHISPIIFMIGIFSALIFLTVVTVAVSYVDLGPANTFVAILVATMKAALVAAFFMHLRYDHPFNAIIFVMSFLFLGLLMIFSAEDTSSRGYIDRDNGEMQLLRYRMVADPVTNDATEMSVEDALRKNPDAKVGDYLTDPLPPIDFGRIAAQTAKQVIVQRVREAERQRQFDEYKDRVGEIVNGTVKRVEYGNVIVDFGRTEAMIRRASPMPVPPLQVTSEALDLVVPVRFKARR
jgi:caa(3)-type oxidase subunit IV